VASPTVRRRRVVLLIVASFMFSAFLAAYLYLFRTGTTPFPPGEVATVRWEWGSPAPSRARGDNTKFTSRSLRESAPFDAC
jgi:hypothetical protein